MHRYRLYVPPEKITGTTARLDGDEFYHCTNVLRRKDGTITVFDGVAREWEATIMAVQRHHAALRLDRLVGEAAAPRVRLIACPALLKGNALDDVVEGATELGAHVISPVIASRCAPRVRKAEPETRLARWHRIAVATAKQCGRIALPEITSPIPLDELLPALAPAMIAICTHGQNATPLLHVLNKLGRDASAIALLIGPEADFAPDEIAAATSVGAHPVDLGQTTLRSSTAVLAALAVASAYLAAD